MKATGSTFILLFTAFLMLLHPGPADASQTCNQAACVYFPLVVKPVPVRVVETTLTTTVMGGNRIVGDVTATVDEPVYNVQVEFRAFDAQGQLVDFGTTHTVFTATLPGQLNPFDLYGHVRTSNPVARTEVIVTGGSLSNYQTFAPLTLIDLQKDALESTIRAKFRNDNPFPLTDVRAAAWSVYPTQFGISPDGIASSIAPGELITYTKYNMSDPGISIDKIRAVAQGIVPKP